MKAPYKSLCIAATGFACLITQANAASILLTAEAITLASGNAPASNNTFNISVQGAYQGYKGTGNNAAGTVATTISSTFNNPIVAYAFYNAATATTVGTYASSGSIIGTPTSANNFSSVNFGKLWVTTASNGSAFDTTANFTSSTGLSQGNGSLAGSINISGMTAGSIYLFYGGYRTPTTLTFDMVGSGTASDINITQAHNGDAANNHENYMVRMDFTNDDGFANINYGLTSGNGWLTGVVVTAIPEPSVALLGALGFLALLRRRR